MWLRARCSAKAHLLEGYTFLERGYFGPGELPQFDRQFFEIPHGRNEEWLFQQFKEKLMNEGLPLRKRLSALPSK